MTSDDLVGEVLGPTGLLEDAGLSVDPVEDRHVLWARPVAAQELLDRLDDKGGLAPLAVDGGHLDSWARSVVGPQGLGCAGPVAFDHRHGGGEDVARGAIILLEEDHLGVEEVFLEVEDVAHVRAAPAVDRLVVVAHDAEVTLRTDDRLEQPILNVVGILKLVDEEEGEAPLELGSDPLVRLEHTHRAVEQVCKIHRLGGPHSLVVEGVDLGDLVLEEVAWLVLVSAETVLLGVVDPPLNRPGGELLGVEPEVSEAPGDHGLLVAVVVDDEVSRELGVLGVGAQELRARRVKGADPGAAEPLTEELPHPRSHLARGLVREGHGEDVPRSHALGTDQVGDPIGDDPGLA